MTQLICHLWGDYILQSDWMAQNKTRAHWPALIHAHLYGLCFWPLTWHRSTDLRVALILEVIIWTHFIIDRWRLARYVVWAKNWLSPLYLWNPDGTFYLGPGTEGITRGGTPPFKVCSVTGYPPECPPWLAVLLLIIADNTLHLTINYLALRFL